MFIHLVRDRDAEAKTPQIRSDFAAARGFVTHDATRPVLRTSSSMAFYRTTDHERFKSKGFVPLTRAEHERHQMLVVCRSQRHFGAETPLTAASGFSCGPSGRTRCMLVGSHDRAIDIVHGPVDLARGIGLLRHGLKETLPETRFAPAIETAGHRAPRTRAFRHIAPRGTGAQHPQDAVEDASMIQSRSTRLRFLRWKQRLEPLPLRVGEFFAFHTGECTPPARVCKHVLVRSALLFVRQARRNSLQLHPPESPHLPERACRPERANP